MNLPGKISLPSWLVLPVRICAAALSLAILLTADPVSAAPVSKARARAARTAQARAVTQAVPVTSIASGAQLTTVHIFASTVGFTPSPSLSIGSDGTVYGTTESGGTFDEGTIFELAADGTYTVLYDFGTAVTDGSVPEAAVTPAPDGFLYGTTTEGGTGNGGTLFRLNPATGLLEILASFITASTGSLPGAPLVTDGKGNFYGVTLEGGVTDDGTLFVYSTASGTLTRLADFTGNLGTLPSSSPVIGPDGNLYGVVNGGGTNGQGTIYQYNPATRALTTIFNFDNVAAGEYPSGPLTFDAQGQFYGTSSIGDDGGGIVYRFTVDPAAQPPAVTPVAIYTFPATDTTDLQSGLLRGVDGDLYGVLTGIYSNTDSLIFQLLPNTPDGNGNLATVDTVHDITGNEGGDVHCTLVSDAAGNLYGTAQIGGGDGQGTLFKLSPVAATAPTRYTFSVPVTFLAPDGRFPLTPFTLGTDGNLYGTTLEGGSDEDGSVFAYSPKTGVTTTFYAFHNLTLHDGSSPSGQLTEASPGIFYGTTAYGGVNSLGTIFRLATAADPATGAVTGTLTSLYSFPAESSDPATLARPQDGLSLAADGALYGVAVGGTGGSVIYRFDPVAGSVTLVASFDSATVGGATPGRLTLAGDGNLYGTTQEGGLAGGGTLFQFNPANGMVTALANLVTIGEQPTGSLLLATDGNLYGTTEYGGASDGGTLFQFIPATGQLTTLIAFNNTIGIKPSGSLVQAADGNFYGTTQSGGADGVGVAYQYNPNTGAFKRLVDFGSTGGAFPVGGLSVTADGTLYGTTAGEGGVDLDDLFTNATQAAAVPAGHLIDEFGTIFHLIVDPTFTSADMASGTQNQPFSFQVTATLVSSGYTASGLPAGLSINTATGLISGMPTAVGVFPVTLSVSDTTDTVTQTLTIFIQDAAAPLPVITSTALPAGMVGTVYTYQVTVGNGPASYGASGLPAGLTIDPATGLISGTPTASGAFPVTLSVSNANGAGAPVTLTLTVAALPVVVPPVVTVAAGGAGAVEGGTAGKVIFQRTGDTTSALTVFYKVKGNAEAGVDYKLLPGTATIPAGAAQVKIKIKSIDNKTVDGTRKAKVHLLPSQDGSYTLGAATVATVKIIDND